jgi:hypothetical protein
MNKFEGSKKDMAQDAKLAKKYKMSPKEYEKSSVDAKHDKQKSMAGLKYGGSMYASGGKVDKGDKVAKRDTPPRGGENFIGAGKPFTGKGKPTSLRKNIKYGMKQAKKRDGAKGDKDPVIMRERARIEAAKKQAGATAPTATTKTATTAPTATTKTATTAPTAAKGPEGMRERMRGLMSPEMRARIEAAKARGAMPTRPEMPTPPARSAAAMPTRPEMPTPPARSAAMPVRPAVMPVRPGMAKGGSINGVAKKGKTATKMVKMASGGSFRSSANGIASKGKTKGRMC